MNSDFSLLKCVFKALRTDNWPAYLQKQLQIVKPARKLRSTIAPRLVTHSITNTFQYSAAKLFNALPARTCEDFNQYCTLCKDLLKVRAVSSL